MPPRYPVYEAQDRLTAQVAVPQSTDQAGLRESIRGGQQLSAAADRVMRFALERGEKQAKLEGYQAGATDPTGTLQSMQGRLPDNSFERAAYDAAVALSSANIETEARTQIGNAWREWKTNKGTPEDLMARITAIRDGYSEAIGMMDPLAAAKLNAKLNGVSQSVYLDYSDDYLKVQAKKLNATRIELYDRVHTEAELLGRGNPAQFDGGLKETIENYRSSAAALGHDPDKIAAEVIKLKDAANLQRARSEFERAPDKAGFLARFKKDATTGKGLARGLDGNVVEALTNTFEADIRHEQAQRRALGVDAKSDVTAYFSMIKNGYNVDRRVLRAISDKASASGDPEAVARANMLESAALIAENLRTKSPQVMSAYANGLREKIGSTPTPEQASILDLVDGMRGRSETALKSDMVAYYNTTHPASPLPTITAQDLLIAARPGDAPPDSPIAMRFAETKKYAFEMGVEWNPFSKIEERAIHQFLTSPDIETSRKLAVVEGIRKSANQDDAIRIVRSIEGGSAGPLVVAAATASMNANFSISVMEGMKAKANGDQLSTDDISREDYLAAEKEALDDNRVSLLTAENRAAVIDSARLALLARARAGAKVDKKAYMRGLNEALGASYDNFGKHIAGGIFDGTRAKLLLSSEMRISDAEELQDLYRKITKEDLIAARELSGLPGEMPRYMNGDEAGIDLIRGGYLTTAGTGKAFLRTYSGTGFKDFYQVDLIQLHRVLSAKYGKRKDG